MRWFCVPNFFRAEKPQRGRLREFMQWNVDVIGGEEHEAVAHDLEVLGCAISAMRAFGLRANALQAKVNDRRTVDALLDRAGIDDSTKDSFLQLIDAWAKLAPAQRQERAGAIGCSTEQVDAVMRAGESDADVKDMIETVTSTAAAHGLDRWTSYDPSIVRGASYTGTGFELIAQGERAVAGGGRYNNLIELFGGPHTPACGFGMGDVVLGNLLDDHQLMPADGAEMMDAIQRTVSGVSLRPEVFVVSGGEEHDHLVQPLLANLRAGVETDGFEGKPWDASRFDLGTGAVRPMHARTTAKATRNLKKLLADAERQHARFAVVIHGEEKAQLKDLDAREDVGDFAIDPASREDADLPQRRPYVGRALIERLGR